MTFTLEYAQKRNGEFVSYIEGGEFATWAEALKAANAHGLDSKDLGEDLLISIFVPTEAQSKYPGMSWEIIWPAYRFLTEQQVRIWYSDALANGEMDEDGLSDTDEMARALHSWGHFTIARRAA